LFGSSPILSPEEFTLIVKGGDIGYADQAEIAEKALCGIHSFVVVTRGSEVLVHRRGNYAEGRRHFVQKQTIGFSSPLAHDDLTLFDIDDHGLVSAGLTALAIDLDFEFSSEFPRFEEIAKLQACAVVPGPAGVASLLGIVRVEAPADFEPTKRRLAINDLSWLNLRPRKSRLTDFDPWSRHILREVQWRVIEDVT
jgi:hypothetical protein